MDALPPPPPASYATAPGDISPRGAREEELCDRASRPDWLYLGALAALDAGAFWWGSTDFFKYAQIGDDARSAGSVAVRLTGPAMIGLTWGATVGGVWLALPQCRRHWVGSPPREGDVRANWPLALSLALLAGATAPIINGIAVGYCNDTVPSTGLPHCQSGLPAIWDDGERAGHVITAGIAGFAGALLPYVIPPRTWAAARELDRLRFGADARGNVLVGYSVVW